VTGLHWNYQAGGMILSALSSAATERASELHVQQRARAETRIDRDQRRYEKGIDGRESRSSFRILSETDHE
jgi:hypothetical protein